MSSEAEEHFIVQSSISELVIHLLHHVCPPPASKCAWCLPACALLRLGLRPVARDCPRAFLAQATGLSRDNPQHVALRPKARLKLEEHKL